MSKDILVSGLGLGLEDLRLWRWAFEVFGGLGFGVLLSTTYGFGKWEPPRNTSKPATQTTNRREADGCNARDGRCKGC